jgi:hypothetical protein
MRVIYVVAVREFGDIHMRVDEHATDAAPDGYGGSLWVEYPALRDPDWVMISKFWVHFNAVRLRLGQFGMDALKEMAKGLSHETG